MISVKSLSFEGSHRLDTYSFLASSEESKDSVQSIIKQQNDQQLDLKFKKREKVLKDESQLDNVFLDIQQQEDDKDDLYVHSYEMKENPDDDFYQQRLTTENFAKQSMFTLVKNHSKAPLVEINSDEEPTHLLYGDTIYISFSGDKDQQLEPQMMFSRGYIEPSVAFHKKQVLGNSVIDLNKCCFQVLPTVDFSAETQIRRQIDKESYDIQKSLVLIRNVDTAINQNLKIQKELLGKPVLYGDNIMLLHCQSGMFLEVKQQKKPAKIFEEHVLNERLESKQNRRKTGKPTNLKHMNTSNYSTKSDRRQSKQFSETVNQSLTSIKELSSFSCQLSANISEWTQFQFNDFLQFQKLADNQIFNKDYFILVHFQSSINLRLNASIKDGEIVFGEAKSELLIERTKLNIEQNLLNEENKELLLFENMESRYVWLSAVYEDIYLNVREQKITEGRQSSRDVTNNKDSPMKHSLSQRANEGISLEGRTQSFTPSQKLQQKFVVTKETSNMGNNSLENRTMLTQRHVDIKKMSPGEETVRSEVTEPLIGMSVNLELGVNFQRVGRNEMHKDEYQVIEDYIRGLNEKASEMTGSNWEDSSKYMKSGIWLLELVRRYPEEQQTGHDSGTGAFYRILLKNVFYNRYLTVVENTQNLEVEGPPKFSVSLTQEPDIFCEFEIKFLDRKVLGESEDEVKPHLIKLLKKFGDNTFVLCLESDHQESQALDKQKFCTLEAYNSVQFWQKKYRDVFKIILPTKDEIWELDFLSQYKRIFEANLQDFESEELLKALKGIRHFLTNKIAGKLSQAYQFGEIVKERQDSIRSFRIFQICINYLEPLKRKAMHADSVAYQCTVSIFKIAETISKDHIQNQIAFFEIFDKIKEYISNSRKICVIIKRIVSNSAFLMKKMVKVTNDVPQNILDLQHDDSFFNHDEGPSFDGGSDKRASVLFDHLKEPKEAKPLDYLEQIVVQIRKAADDKHNRQSTQEPELGSRETQVKRTTLAQLMKQKILQTLAEEEEEEANIDLIKINKIIGFFIRRMIRNEEQGKPKMNILHLLILQQFMKVSIDDGIFWNQWFIFKQLYPLNKEDQEMKGPLKRLKLKTFLPLYFLEDKIMFIGKEDRDITSDELKDMGLIWQSVKQQLSLIVSLCAGENYICINFFKRFFTDKVLINLLKQDSQYHQYIRPQVLNLLYVLHLVNNYAQNRVQMPEYIWFEKAEQQAQPQGSFIVESILKEADIYFRRLGNQIMPTELETDHISDEELMIDIANQYLLIFLRCLNYNKAFFRPKITRMLFGILSSTMKHIYSHRQGKNQIQQTFHLARELEFSKRINLQFIQKILLLKQDVDQDGEGISKQMNLYEKIRNLGYREGDDPEMIKKLEQIATVVLGSSINTKMRFINKICNQHQTVFPKHLQNLSQSASINMTLSFEILNNLEKQKSNLFITNFLSKYLENSMFQHSQDKIKLKKLTATLQDMINESFEETDEQFRMMMTEEQQIKQSKTVSQDNEQLELNKIIIEQKFEDKFSQFLLLFNNIESSQTQEELLQLYFSIMNEKQNQIQCLREIIILRQDKERQDYEMIKECLINLSKYHESSEIWLFNHENFKQQNQVIMPNIENIIKVIEMNSEQRSLYQFIIEKLEGDALIMNMLREYKPYVRQVIMNKLVDSSIYQVFIKRLYYLLVISLKNNEGKKLAYIDQLNNFYPISSKKDLGEVRLASQIIKFKDMKLSYFQLETAHVYVLNVWKDLKAHKEKRLENPQFLRKILYLLKIMLVLLNNSFNIDDDLVQYVVQFTLNFNILRARDSTTLKIMKMLLEALVQIMQKNMLKRYQVGLLKRIFSYKDNRIENYFFHIDLQIKEQEVQCSFDKQIQLRKLHANINASLRSMFFTLFNQKIQKMEDKSKFNMMIGQLFIDRINDEVSNYSIEKRSQVIRHLRIVQQKSATKKAIDNLSRLIANVLDQNEIELQRLQSMRRASIRLTTNGRNEFLDQEEEEEVKSEQDILEYKLSRTVLSYLKKLTQREFERDKLMFGDMIIKKIQSKVKVDDAPLFEFKIINMYRKMIEVLKMGAQASQTTSSVSQIQNIIYNINSLFDSIGNSDAFEAVKTYNFKEIQQNLDGLNYTDTILQLMSQKTPLTIELQPDLLFAMNNMLINGPDLIQDKIYEHFMSSSQTEAIFNNLSKFIDDVVRQLEYEIKQIQERRNPIQSYSNITKILRKQTTFSSSKTQLLENVVMFTKQLCEGHHSNNQKYLTNQTNLTKSVSMLQAIIQLMEQELMCLFQIRSDLSDEFNLGHKLFDDSDAVKRMKKDKQYAEQVESEKRVFLTYEKKIIKKTFDQLLQAVNICLITILEMIQGPCVQNQKIILESQFLEIAKKILNMHNINTLDNESAKYKFWNELVDAKAYDYRLQIIKTNLISVILEMFEGPSKEENMIRIQQTISIEDFEKNITRFYKMMLINNVVYGDSLYFNIFKEFDEIFYYKQVKNRKVVETKMGQQNSWMIIESAINAQIAREIILSSFSTNEKQVQEFKFQFMNVFLISSIVRYFTQFLNFCKDFLLSFKFCRSKAFLRKENKPRLKKEALEFFESIIKSIEVVIDGKPQTIYFPKLPLCNFLNKEIQQNFEVNCDRSSQKSKVESLMNMQESLIITLLSEAKYMDNIVFRKLRFLMAFALHVNFFKDTAFYFLICVHLYIIFTYDTKGYTVLIQQVEYMVPIMKTTYSLVWVMVGFASFIFFFDVLKRIITVSLQQRYLLIARSEKLLQAKNASKQVDIEQFRETIQQKFMTVFIVIWKLITDFNFNYYSAYIICAILAVIIHPFFLAFHLCDIIIRSPLLKNVLKAVYEPKEQLFLTVIIFLVFEYIFALIAFGFLYDNFPDYDCTGSLVMCYVIILDQTFKQNDGIGGYMIQPYNTQIYGSASPDFVEPSQEAFFPVDSRQDPSENYIDYTIIIYEQLFNFILLILILNIFAGIIIDTFSKLREQQSDLDEDMKNNCCICGMKREDIEKTEKRREAFRYHIEILHSHWNYIFYLCFLKQKPETEYTGVESYIMGKIQDQDNTWFPDQSTHESR